MSMMADPREENFRRLATLRANVVMDGLRKLGNLANRGAYKWDEEAVARIFKEIRNRTFEAEARYKAGQKRQFRL
jgi:hypothetical protein